MKEQKSFNFSLLYILIVICIATSALIVVWICKFGNTPQVYKDIVLNRMGQEFANKSIELELHVLVSVIGLIALLFAYVKKGGGIFQSACEKWSDDKLVSICILAFMAATLVFWSHLCINTLLLLFVALIAMFLKRIKAIDAIALFIICLYSIFSCYELLAFIGKMGAISQTTSFLLALVAFLCCTTIMFKASDKLSIWIIIFQIPIPFLLLIYLVSRYSYNNEIINIRPNIYVYILITGLILFSLIALIFKIKSYKHGIIEIEDCISYFSIVAIMTFNRFCGTGFIMTTDMHHPAENTIAYNELINLGQKYYSEYIPVSGLFSVLQGAFLQLFGDGKYTAYYLADNVFYLFVILLTVAAIRLHLNSVLTLIISSFIYIDYYSRVVFILPFFLILSSKILIQKPVAWYFSWFILSWFYGLYYPAYGVAIMLSMIPTALYEGPRLLAYMREANRAHRAMFCILFLISIVITAVSMPIIIQTAQHIIDMSDGLLYHESEPAFGVFWDRTEEFMKYFSNNSLLFTTRLIVNYILAFITPAFVIWLSFSSILSSLSFCEKKKLPNISNWSYEKTNVISTFIFPPICFYFSLHKLLGFKAMYIVVYSLILIIVILYEQEKVSSAKYIIMILACITISLANKAGIENIADVALAEYVVPEDYSYVEQSDDCPNLGTGFVKNDLLVLIQSAAEQFNKLDKNKNYYMLFSDSDYGMGFDYILNIKGSGMLESLEVRGNAISSYQAKTLVNTKAIVGYCISPVDHYYLYKWLMTSGYYIWDNANNIFIPANDEPLEDIISVNSKAIMKLFSIDVGEYGASLGNSIQSLEENVLEQVDVLYERNDEDPYFTLEFHEPILGNDIDYIYVEAELDNNETPYIIGSDYNDFNRLDYFLTRHKYNDGLKLVAEWNDNSGGTFTMYADIENGKVLLPIGAGNRWLCNNHSNVIIWFEQDGNIIDAPKINGVNFYSVRGINIE